MRQRGTRPGGQIERSNADADNADRMCWTRMTRTRRIELPDADDADSADWITRRGLRERRGIEIRDADNADSADWVTRRGWREWARIQQTRNASGSNFNQ